MTIKAKLAKLRETYPTATPVLQDEIKKTAEELKKLDMDTILCLQCEIKPNLPGLSAFCSGECKEKYWGSNKEGVKNKRTFANKYELMSAVRELGKGRPEAAPTEINEQEVLDIFRVIDH